MWPNIFEYGFLKVTFFGLYLLFSGLLFGFGLWKRLRLETTDEQIFGLTIKLYLGIFAGSLVGNLIETGRWFGLSGWGIIFTVGLILKKWCDLNKVDLWELFDWVSLFGLWLWFFGALAYGPETKFAAIAAITSIILVSVVKVNYRRFSWYKTGRVGIVGLASMTAYSLYEIAMGIIAPINVYWWGLTLGQTIFAWVMASCLVIVYVRGGNKFRFGHGTIKTQTS